MNFGSRLSSAMVAGGFLTNAMLSKRTGISDKELKPWKKSRDVPEMRAKTLLDLAMALNIRPLWLAYGTGPIFRTFPSAFTDTELVSMFHMLRPAQKDLVREMIGIIMRSNEIE